MGLGRRGVYDGWAKPGSRRFSQSARGFDIAIGNRGRFTGRFWRSHSLFCLALAPAFFRGRAARRRGGAGCRWYGILRRGVTNPKACQQTGK